MRFRLRPRSWFPLFLAIWLGMGSALLALVGLRTNYRWIFQDYLRLVMSFYPYLLGLDALISAARAWTERKQATPIQSLGRFAGRQGTLIVGMLAVVLVSSQYTQVKSVIPYLCPVTIDGFLISVEKALFLGHFPVDFAKEAVSRGGGVAFWDYIYTHSFHALYLGCLLVLLLGSRENLARYLRAICFIYMLGLAFAVAIPSKGPAFVNPASWAADPSTISFQAQRYMASAVQFLLARPAEFLPKPYLGISAFPSVHVALAFLPMLFFRRAHRWTLVFTLPLCGLIAVSTVVLGWHYAVDAPAGALLAWAAYALTTPGAPAQFQRRV